MAVSKRYLEYTDEIYFNRLYECWNKQELLNNLQEEWLWLRENWQTAERDVIDGLLNISCMSYELLTRFTVYEWDEVIAAAKDLHIRKNAGYSPSETDAWTNFRVCTQFGIPATDGCLVRLCDKYSRFFSVYANPENDKVGESAIDTLKDLAAYSVILIVLLEEKG